MAGAAARRDAKLTHFGRSLVEAARDSHGDRIIAEGQGDARQLYTETHYALAAVLLYACDRKDRAMLDLAEARLRLWAAGPHPLTFFNAMAYCLAAIVLKQSGAAHPGLEAILGDLLARTREHRHIAYPQWCGNNAYLQQVAVDTLLLPIARGQAVTAEGLDLLLRQFRSFRTSEGLFYDLPRSGLKQERLSPPTYIMKMLFLLGICHEVHPAASLAELFRQGMATVLPLLTRDGQFSYFGRTDNSPFAAGLTIFNLRKAAQLSPTTRHECEAVCVRAEQFYRTFPRATSGLLECNRFDDAASEREAELSRDDYAYVAQYSLSSCAYALLGCHWFPASSTDSNGLHHAEQPDVADSKDLGIVRVSGQGHELVVRTSSEITSWDRRYLGPTILRYTVNDRLLVGAISRTVSTDEKVETDRPSGRASSSTPRRLGSYRCSGAALRTMSRIRR